MILPQHLLYSTAVSIQPSSSSPGNSHAATSNNAGVSIIGTLMFDEEDAWHVMVESHPGEFDRVRELRREEMVSLPTLGVVTKAVVRYPCASRYGVPDEATPQGLLAWLHEEHRMPVCGLSELQLHFEDSRDDSSAECVLFIRRSRPVDAIPGSAGSWTDSAA